MSNVKQNKTKLCRTLAPEEIRPGQYIAVLQTTCEYLPLGPLFDLTVGVPETLTPVRVRWLSPENVLLRVRAVCLPFVLVEQPSGDWESLDMRRVRVAQLKRSYATLAWKHFARQARKEARRAEKAERSEC